MPTRRGERCSRRAPASHLRAADQYAVFSNFVATELDAPNPEVPHDPHEFLAAAASRTTSSRDAAVAAEAEAPLRGGGNSYDFEAMLEAELRRQEAAQGPQGQAS